MGIFLIKFISLKLSSTQLLQLFHGTRVMDCHLCQTCVEQTLIILLVGEIFTTVYNPFIALKFLLLNAIFAYFRKQDRRATFIEERWSIARFHQFDKRQKLTSVTHERLSRYAYFTSTVDVVVRLLCRHPRFNSQFWLKVKLRGSWDICLEWRSPTTKTTLKSESLTVLCTWKIREDKMLILYCVFIQSSLKK